MVKILSISISLQPSPSPLMLNYTPMHVLTMPASSLTSLPLISLSDSMSKPTTSASLLKLWLFPQVQSPYWCFAPQPLPFTWREQCPTCCISCPSQRFITVICLVLNQHPRSLGHDFSFRNHAQWCWGTMVILRAQHSGEIPCSSQRMPAFLQ